MSRDQWIAELQQQLGPAVRTQLDPAEPVSDRSGWTEPGVPAAVVTAGSVEDVQTVLRIAHEHQEARR